MMVFLPTVATAAKYRGYAARLASSLLMVGALSQNRVLDGYLFRAQRVARDMAKVYVIDLPARWLLAGWHDYEGVSPDPNSSMFVGLDRGLLTPTEAWQAQDVKAIDSSNAQRPLTPRITFFQASFGGGFFYGDGRADWFGEYAAVVTISVDRQGGNIQSLPNYDPDLEFRITATVFTWRMGGTPLLDEAPAAQITLDNQMSFGVSETGIRAWSGKPHFRFTQNPRRWTESVIALVGVPVIEGAMDRYVLAATCCVQATNLSVDSGFMVGRFEAARVIGSETPNLRQAGAMWGNIQLLSENVDPELRPQLSSIGGYLRNTIYDLGMLETDSKVIMVASCMLRKEGGGSDVFLTTATQIYTFDRVTGAASVVLDYKATVPATNPMSAIRRVTHCLNQVRYTVQGSKRTGLAAVQFNISDAVDVSSVDLILYDETGNPSISGLRAAGYVPFWPKLRGEYSSWSFADDIGYVTHASHSVVREIGPGRLGVMAALASDAGSAGSIEWRLVVLDAGTLQVIEVRGVVAVQPDSTFASVGFTVISQEMLDEDGAIVAPAILMGTEGIVADGTQKLSRDGGLTWVPVFTGSNWPALYMGNGLHPVTFY
jgi:hypothetical protein